MEMHKPVRDAVREVMNERGLSQVRLARELDIDRVSLTRLLSGRVNGVTPTWQKVLDALDLELTVQKKGSNGG